MGNLVAYVLGVIICFTFIYLIVDRVMDSSC